MVIIIDPKIEHNTGISSTIMYLKQKYKLPYDEMY
jgi:hypothetical protein